jgi:hypothetical protein
VIYQEFKLFNPIPLREFARCLLASFQATRAFHPPTSPKQQTIPSEIIAADSPASGQSLWAATCPNTASLLQHWRRLL